eukprot:7132255-Pyramimonas_sp.AAC.1
MPDTAFAYTRLPTRCLRGLMVPVGTYGGEHRSGQRQKKQNWLPAPGPRGPKHCGCALPGRVRFAELHAVLPRVW